jgi:uncharacterized protein (DUF1499 family)
MQRFAPPPKSPNCVSSRAEPSDAEHHVAPLQGVRLEDAKAWLLSQPRTVLVEEDGDYLRFEVTSRIFRFTDDLELHQEGDQLHVRSASRVGYSDLGANRKRVEALRSAVGG